jgi:Protein of unknown function (DUF3501)
VEKIRFDEIKNLYEYEKVREAFRQEIIALKARRRVSVGDRLSFLFEDRRTVLFQIQEMIRAERIVADARVRDEIDVYNDLIPAPGELSATMMIEIVNKDRIKPVLDSLLGIDSGEHVWLTVGSHVARGRFEAGHSKEDKIAAVHFVRFPVPEPARRLFARGPVTLVVEHPGYRAQAELSTETRQLLAEDLREQR